MHLQSLVQRLLPKEDRFFTLLERQARVIHEGANALARFREVETSATEVSRILQDLEHKGDQAGHELEDALARTFVTPVDREDLHKLSNDLDNVIDLLSLAARSCVLFGVTRPTPPMVELMDILIQATRKLEEAVPLLRQRSFSEVIHAGKCVRRLERDGDLVFRGAVSELFQDPAVDAKQLLREKEVLENLENAIDYCDHVGATLTHLAVKHG